MLLVPTQPVPNQNFQIVLAAQQCSFNIYQTAYGMFMDLSVAGVPVITGQICENNEPMVNQVYTGFTGDLQWVDTQEVNGQGLDPIYTGLGSRFVLVYLEASDLAAAA